MKSERIQIGQGIFRWITGGKKKRDASSLMVAVKVKKFEQGQAPVGASKGGN